MRGSVRGALLLLAACANRAVAAQGPLEHFTVVVDRHPVAVWARRAEHPAGAILLVHGRTWSARPDFDLQVPGESRSILAALAARGYDAYAIDLRGYGATPPDPSGWLTPRRAADDVSQVLAWIRTKEGTDARPVLIGWSVGALVSQFVAQLHPQLMSALVLYGYPRDPDEPIDADQGRGPAPHERNTAAAAMSDFVSPAVTSPRMVAAYVAAALQADPYFAEWRNFNQFNALDAARVHLPTLLVQGEHDPESRDVLRRLFNRLGTADKEWTTLEGGDHAALLEDTKPTFIEAVVKFIRRKEK